MNSIKKLFVPYQEALDIKLLGFDKDCFCYYNDNYNLSNIGLFYCFDNPSDFVCLAPTYSQCFSWFREKYKLNSHIYFLGADYPTVDKYFTAYNYNINEDIGDNIVELYEEAELECLKKLIKICRE